MELRIHIGKLSYNLIKHLGHSNEKHFDFFDKSLFWDVLVSFDKNSAWMDVLVDLVVFSLLSSDFFHFHIFFNIAVERAGGLLPRAFQPIPSSLSSDCPIWYHPGVYLFSFPFFFLSFFYFSFLQIILINILMY